MKLFQRLMLLAFLVTLVEGANAQGSYIVNRVKYSLNSDTKEATVKECSAAGSIVVPSSFTTPDGTEYTVTAIENFAFNFNQSVISVELPNTIRRIGTCGFQWCTKLTSINIPDGVVSIGSSCFTLCN